MGEDDVLAGKTIGLDARTLKEVGRGEGYLATSLAAWVEDWRAKVKK